MAAQIFAYILHSDGVVDDSATELITAAKKIDAAAQPTAIVFGDGPELEQTCEQVAKTYASVWKIGGEAFAYPNAETIRKALQALLPADAVLLVPHTTFGMDLAPGLAVKMGSAFVADVVGIVGVEGSKLKVVRQEFGGQISTHVVCEMSAGLVLNTRGGTFAAEEGGSAGGAVTDKSGEVGDLTADRTFVEVVAAEVGDVDITKEDVLVSIGRGIEDQDNIEIAEDLAEAMGAAVSCSRPIVDAKWLEKSRQVGTSGQTVKPKVYLACGISGSFQHMGGIKGNPFIVAINKNPKAPIFQVADVGIEEDILEFLPELTEKISELK
jgi:electron transfer flavoprotein alpha subunit